MPRSSRHRLSLKPRGIEQRLHPKRRGVHRAQGHTALANAQEGEAVAKWKRARLSSSQLSTYFVGVTEHLALREQAKARDGAKFDLKKYNDTVISFGSPPVKYVREMMGL